MKDFYDELEGVEGDDLLAVLARQARWMANRRTRGAWSLEELNELLADEDVLEGPFVREIPGRGQQFYAYVKA